jgi:DnaJ-domain-containing protein 1
MGVFDRLGDVIRSYINDLGPGPSGDPDLDAAFEELDDFLAGDKPRFEEEGYASQEGGADARRSGSAGPGTPPESLRRDFDELELPFGASAEECKKAYKQLLKLHHPDRHAGHEGNIRKATAKSARINAAYDRIEKWRETGKAE